MTSASAIGSASTSAATSVNYATDTMLRSDHPSGASADTTRMEITRLLSRGSDLQDGDKNYLAHKVATETGLTPQQAQQRVDVAMTAIRESADKARRASSALAFFTALSMLIGAFIASSAAAYGGHLRDESSDIIEQI